MFESLPGFDAEGRAINAGSILPNLLRDFGDVADVLELVQPRKVLLAAGIGPTPPARATFRVTAKPFRGDPQSLIDWIAGT